MCGKEMMQFGRVDEVNINGICRILDACNELGVRRPVNGNEALSCFQMDDHVDSYGRSKSVAEQFVLKMNGRPSKVTGKCLYTCAMHPAAIYGPGEERHFPRILSLAKLSLLPFKIGANSVKSDWLYVDNLVLALIMASMRLLDDIRGKGKKPIAAGQPYFICDALTLRVSRVTHYFSYLKAKEELGYTPVVSPKDGMSATISYWQEKKRTELDGPTFLTWVLVVGGMFAYFAAGYLPNVGPVRRIRAPSLLIFRSMFLVRMGSSWQWLFISLKQLTAWSLAKKVDPRNAKGWFWQTAVLGFFSMSSSEKIQNS